MKIRSDYVTNSSSTSYIISLDKDKYTKKEIGDIQKDFGIYLTIYKNISDIIEDMDINDEYVIDKLEKLMKKKDVAMVLYPNIFEGNVGKIIHNEYDGWNV